MATREDAERLKKDLKLLPHPGDTGFFLEKWRADRKVTFVNPTSHESGVRDSSSSIYFMLEGKSFISWHILLSDEFFYWHAGGEIKLHLLDKGGNYSVHLIGDMLKNPDCAYYAAIPHDTWYAVQIADGSPFVLYSAGVAPGWDIRDWTEGKKDDLVAQFPQHKEKFEQLCKI